MTAAQFSEMRRDATGRFVPGMTIDALTRFRAFCKFDPFTGCVLWIGGTSAGRGNSTRYGVFKYEGHKWYAHRWAAVFIHGFDLGDKTVGHCCPHGPNPLCVQHVKPETLSENVIERNVRVAAQARQTNQERQFWLFVQLGIEPLPDLKQEPQTIPWYSPPEWLGVRVSSDEPPF